MTYYKYTQFLMYEDGPDYDETSKPGTSAPFSGIYYCEVCGGSITAVRSATAAVAGTSPSHPVQGPIRWRLAVKSHYG